MRSFLKKFKLGSLLGGLFLGALGSGFWEKFLSPFLTSLSTSFIHLISGLSQSFSDSLYFEASQGFHESSSVVLYTLMSSVFGGLFLGFILIMFKLRRRDLRGSILGDSKDILDSPLFQNFYSVVVVIYVILSVYSAAKNSYVNRITTTTLNNIEILSPYVTDQDYKMMRSEFFSMDGKADYDELLEELNVFADKYDVELRK